VRRSPGGFHLGLPIYICFQYRSDRSIGALANSRCNYVMASTVFPVASSSRVRPSKVLGVTSDGSGLHWWSRPNQAFANSKPMRGAATEGTGAHHRMMFDFT
jgi:hypothetical protein